MAIYVTGDKHGSIGNFRVAVSQIQNPTEEDIIILAGDVGLAYGNYYNSQCKKFMKKFPGSWIVMRGNHDTRYWRDYQDADGWEIVEKWRTDLLVQKKYPNIYYVRDEGDLLDINGHMFLFVPGAYSVDKWYRLGSGKPYEWDEQLTYEELAELFERVETWQDKIEYVIGHTFPLKLEPQLRYLFMSNIPQGEIEKITEKWLDYVMDMIEPNGVFKHYYGGHFHDDKKLTNKYTILYHTVERIEE